MHPDLAIPNTRPWLSRLELSVPNRLPYAPFHSDYVAAALVPRQRPPLRGAGTLPFWRLRSWQRVPALGTRGLTRVHIAAALGACIPQRVRRLRRQGVAQPLDFAREYGNRHSEQDKGKDQGKYA